MRPKRFVINNTVTETPFYPLARRTGTFAVGVIAKAANGVTPGAVNALITNADLGRKVRAFVTQSTTTVTLTFDSAHGLAAGDYVAIQGTGIPYIDTTLKIAGVTNATVATVTVGTSATVTSTECKAVTLPVVTLALDVTKDNLINSPGTAIKISAAATTGTITVDIVQAGSY